jgi:hypothetical protein
MFFMEIFKYAVLYSTVSLIKTTYHYYSSCSFIKKCCKIPSYLTTTS